MSTRTVAAIDCGTNSIRLLIVRLNDQDGRDDGAMNFGQPAVQELTRRNRIVRLGQGVDATGELASEALIRVAVALEEYTGAMLEYGVTDVRMVATSATRDASNRDEFFELTRRYLSQIVPDGEAEVIDGDEEARLSYRGATADTETSDADDAATCVIDLGGGSTEFIVGRDKDILGALSTQMGCVRLTERFLHSDPPTEEEVDAARAYVREQLDKVQATVPIDKVTKVVGVAGTLTTLSALVQGLQKYDPERIHQSVLSFDDLRRINAQLRSETCVQRGEHEVIMSGREDVIIGGSIVVDEFLDMFEQQGITSLEISERDILDGIVASVIDRQR